MARGKGGRETKTRRQFSDDDGNDHHSPPHHHPSDDSPEKSWKEECRRKEKNQRKRSLEMRMKLIFESRSVSCQRIICHFSPFSLFISHS